MADPCSVDAAVLALLRADAALLALCPGGVHYGLAENGAERFVIVDRLVAFDDVRLFGGTAWEDFVYLVKAVIPGTSSSEARQAAVRIRALLDGTLALAPVGYALVAPSEQIEPVREVEVDESNPDRRVQHIGGQYAVRVQALD